MSKQIFEQHVDDYGNISVRVSDEVVVLTRDEAERLKERFDQLEAENAELREERDCVGMAAYELGRKSMADENAKLRELVDYMTPIAWYAASEWERERMRKLGIEVD